MPVDQRCEMCDATTVHEVIELGSQRDHGMLLVCAECGRMTKQQQRVGRAEEEVGTS